MFMLYWITRYNVCSVHWGWGDFSILRGYPEYIGPLSGVHWGSSVHWRAIMIFCGGYLKYIRRYSIEYIARNSVLLLSTDVLTNPWCTQDSSPPPHGIIIDFQCTDPPWCTPDGSQRIPGRIFTSGAEQCWYVILKLNMLCNLCCLKTRLRLLCNKYQGHSSLNLVLQQLKLCNILIFGMVYPEQYNCSKSSVPTLNKSFVQYSRLVVRS